MLCVPYDVKLTPFLTFDLMESSHQYPRNHLGVVMRFVSLWPGCVAGLGDMMSERERDVVTLELTLGHNLGRGEHSLGRHYIACTVYCATILGCRWRRWRGWGPSRGPGPRLTSGGWWMLSEAGQINSEQHRIPTVNTAATRASQPALCCREHGDQYRDGSSLSAGRRHWPAPASVLLAGPIRGGVTSVIATHWPRVSAVTGGWSVVRPVAGPGEPDMEQWAASSQETVTRRHPVTRSRSQVIRMWVELTQRMWHMWQYWPEASDPGWCDVTRMIPAEGGAVGGSPRTPPRSWWGSPSRGWRGWGWSRWRSSSWPCVSTQVCHNLINVKYVQGSFINSPPLSLCLQIRHCHTEEANALLVVCSGHGRWIS